MKICVLCVLMMALVAGAESEPFNHSTIQPSTRPPLPSCAFVPAAAGIIIGGEVVKNLIEL